MKNWKRYTIKAIIISIILGGGYYFFFPERSTLSYTIMATIYMWMPGILGIIFIKKQGGSLSDLGLKLNFSKWYLFAWLIFPTIILFGIGINTLFPGVSFSIQMTDFLESYRPLLEESGQYTEMLELLENQPWIPLVSTVVSGLLAGITINLAAAIGEEIGWRGYLYRELKYMGFWKMTGLTGLIWGVWHAPLILQGHNYPEYPVLGVFLMIIWCLLLSPVFSLVRMKSRSVWPAGIAHGTLNALAGASIIYIVGGNSIINGIIGISGFIALLITDILIFLKIGRNPEDFR